MSRGEDGPCRPPGTMYSSLILKKQLRDGVAPIEACAFNTLRHEFLAVDTAALRVWSLKRELKAVITPKVGGPAIAAFCLERDGIYIVVYRGRKYGKADTSDSTPLPSTPGCIIYNARLCVLNQFCPCESEVVSASFCQSTGILLIAGKDAILRVFSILSSKTSSPPGPRSTTAAMNIQVTAREICHLEGPIKPVPMTLLEIDSHCDLVVGTNGTDAFLWQMLSPREKNPGTSKLFDDLDDVSGRSQNGSNGCYKYLGSILDLQSCEITALSVRSPLLATGLANGKIFLWRLHLEQARVRKKILSVVDAHGALPVLNLDFLLPEGSRQPLTLGGSPSYRLELGDWSIFSGGADGTVLQWAILGFSGGQAASGSKEDVRLHKIGAYEATGGERSMRKTARSGLIGGSHIYDKRHRQAGSIMDRRLSVTHVMVVQLSACPAPSSVDAAAGATSVATREEHKLTRQDDSGSLPCEYGDRARTPGNIAFCERKSMCLAVSGGLVSVLDVVEPLFHVGWARALSRRFLDKREILSMARTPCWWGALAQIGGRGVTGREKLQAKVPDKSGPLVAGAVNSAAGYLAAEGVDSGTILGDDDRGGFLVMSECGWLGWYQGYNGEFELVSEIELTSLETTKSSLPVRAKPTCFMPCLTDSGEARNNEKLTWKTTPSKTRPKNAMIAQEERIAVGYSDGSIALLSFPLFSPTTREGGGQRDPVRMTTRRIKRVELDGGMTFEASITALCALCASLIVVGDSEGRLALWTTLASSSSAGSSLLWEDKAAHRGPVIAIQRQSLLQPSPVASVDLVGASPSPGPRESVVSAGRGGEIRIWNVPLRWQRADVRVSRPVGLEFFATILTNTSISSSLSVLVGPPISTSDGCDGGWLCDKTEDGHFSGDPVEGADAIKTRPRQEQGGQQKRLYCVVGSNKGLVQAWEVDVSGGRAVKKQPIWSRKVHDHAVTTMDAFRVDTWSSTSRSAKDEQIFPSTSTMSGQLHGNEDPDAEYLVLSGSLDRSLCIFRVKYGEGLCILRRLNMGCAPRGLPGALFVDLQTKVEASGKDNPTHEIGIILATGDGEITRIGFQHERDTVEQPLALAEAHKGATYGSNLPRRPTEQTAGAHSNDQIPDTTGILSDGVTAESSGREIDFANVGIVEDSSSTSIGTDRSVLRTTPRHLAKDRDEDSNYCLGSGEKLSNHPVSHLLGGKNTTDGWGMMMCEDHTSTRSLKNGLSIASIPEFMETVSHPVDGKQQQQQHQQQQQQQRQRASVDVRVPNGTEQAISRRDSQLFCYRRENNGRREGKKRLRVEGNNSLLAAEAETSRQLDSLQVSFVGGMMKRGGNCSAKKHGHREAPSSAVDLGREKYRMVSPRSSEANAEILCSGMDIGERTGIDQTAWAMVETEEGFSGDSWQQGAGVSLADGIMGANNGRVVSAKGLLNDRRLREIYIARGRHKKSPVLAREVKAIIKEWSPGLVEACSLVDLGSAMNGLRGDERVSFEAVCEIAAAITACNTAFCPGSFGRPTVLSRRSTGNGKKSRLVNKPCGHSATVRPPRYRDMVKSKIRLEYNSMGEKVVVRTAVETIDAYATRYEQRSCSNQVLERKQLSVELSSTFNVEKASSWVSEITEEPQPTLAEEAPKSAIEEGGSKRPVSGGREGDMTTLTQRDLFSVSRGLGFGFPDFSSVGSRVREMLNKDKIDGSGTRPSRESSAECLGNVPAGLKKMWSRQGTYLFRSRSDSRVKYGENSLAEKTAGREDIFSEAKCVHIVRDLLNTRASAAVSALVACRRRGRCSPEAHSLVVGDAIRHRIGGHISTRATSEGPFRSTDTITMASTSKETAGQVDAEIQSVPLDVDADWMKEATTSSRGTSNAVLNPTLRVDPSCPANGIESLGDMIYGQFRRRYGLLSTAEERLAAFIGSVAEHARSSAVLRLFARIIGVPTENLGEREHPRPYRTRTEDIHRTLENALAELVYGARDWLIVRGFMTTDGPCVGSTAGGNTAGGSRTSSWRRAVVSRTHAAMCATAVLKSGWGSGHKIMGAAELVILDLPTVRTSGKGAHRCDLEPWSEFVDGEEFLEALLVLVLRAREFSVRAEDRLFGANAVAGHSFLLAHARDINKKSLRSPVSSYVQGLLEDVPETSAIDRASVTETRAVEGLIGQADGMTSLENDPRPRSRLKDRVEELGADGALLRRLQPLLDSFIREDTHRTGTLNARDFRRVLCEGHGGLWGDLGITIRARRTIEPIDAGSPPETGAPRIIGLPGFAAEYVDPRLTQAEDEAARLLVRRFTDVYDGQVCYLDVWLTLYYAVFESGQVVPFVNLPFLCETQLRGADSEHWEALLDYLDATGTTCPPLPASTTARSHDHNTLHDNVGGPLKSAHLDEQQLRQPRQSAIVDERGTPSALTAGIGSAPPLANYQSTPTLGVLRTTIEGGATSSHSVEVANAGLVSFSKKIPSTSTSKNAMDWPQAGWGPGSLTVSHPPLIESLSGTVASPAVVTIAMKAAQAATTGPRSGGMKVSPTTVDEARVEPSGDGKMVASSKGQIEDPILPTSMESILKDSRMEDEEGKEEHPEVGVGGMDMESMVSHLRKQLGLGDTTQESDTLQKNSFNTNSDSNCGPREHFDDDSGSLYNNDELFSKSASKLLYNLDCGTLEPPSPEPPSHGPQSVSVATKEDDREYAATYERRGRRERRQKRIITSIYVRCPFLEPVKSKHAYRVPRGGVSARPDIPFFREPPCTISSSIPDPEAAEPSSHGKEAMLLHVEKGTIRSDSSKGEGEGVKGALPAVMTGREPWTQQQQTINRTGVEIDVKDLGFNAAEDFVLKGTTAGERVVNSKGSSGASRGNRSPPRRSLSPHPCESPGQEMMRATTEQGRVEGPGNPADGATSEVHQRLDVPSKLGGEARTGKSWECLRKAVRRATMRDKRGMRTSEYDSDDDCGATSFRSKVGSNKIAQQKMIVTMMADQVAKRRASAEAMRKLISDEEQRKQQLKEEEKEAARLAEEKAAKEAEERQRREQEQRRKAEKAAIEAEERRRRDLEERKKALAQKKDELARTNSRLEEKRLKREAEKKLAEQAKREEWERLRKEEEATRAEEERRTREKKARLAREKEERRRRVEEEKLRDEEEARERFLLEQEMAKEDKERQKMAQHDEDIDIVLQKNLALLYEAKQKEEEAEAARKAELLERAAEGARWKHSCSMMSKADEESRLWNERLLMEEKMVRGNQLELERKEKRRRTRVTRDKNGHPIDIRLWGIECTVETDSDGRLVQRETYGDINGYIFDPKEVFQGEGGGIGGRGGGEGDGTTLGLDDHAECDAATTVGIGDADACLDPEAFFDRERRWLQEILATCSLEDIGRLFRDMHNDSPDDFFPMVLGKRIAWTEYMEMVRTALLEQARATITIPAEMVAASDTKYTGSDGIYEAVSNGSRALIFNAGSSRGNHDGKREGSSRRSLLHSCPLNTFHDTSATGSDTSHDHTRTSGASSPLRSAATTRGGISGQHVDSTQHEVQTHMISMSTSTSTSTVVQEIKIGQQYRCETGAHHNPWTFFRFKLASTGSILTVMLEAECCDLALFVARERVPTNEEGGDWENSSAMRTKRVIRIFPHDPRYSPGEYYIGVRSTDIPSRFTLMVTSASAEEEISAHMRVAEAIVDSLSIMANMDPQRLVRDFEGARLEAKETLRKRQDASCFIQGSPSPPGSAGIAEMKRQQQHKLTQEGSLSRRTTSASQPLRTSAVLLTPWAEAPPLTAQAEDLRENYTTSTSLSPPPEGTAIGQQSLQEEEVTPFPCALRRQEHHISSSTPVLDDRNLTGLMPTAASALSASGSAADRASNRGSGLTSIPTGSFTDIPDHHRFDRRHHRLTTPLQPNDSCNEGRRGVGIVDARQRLSRTSLCEEATAREASRRRGGRSEVELAPVRYSIQRLPNTFSTCLRRGDHLSRKPPHFVTTTGNEANLEKRRTRQLSGDGEILMIKTTTRNHSDPTFPGAITSASCGVWSTDYNASLKGVDPNDDRRADQILTRDGSGSPSGMVVKESGFDSPFDLTRKRRCVPLEGHQGTVSSLSTSPSRQPGSRSSSFLNQALPTGNPVVPSQTSTRLSSRSRSRKKGRSKEGDTVKEETKRALSKSKPNLFPEILGGLSGRGGSRRGWLASR